MNWTRIPKELMTPRHLVGFCVFLICISLSQAKAAVLVGPPNQAIELLDEVAFLFFDPLAGQQTTLVRHKIKSVRVPYGIIFPVPRAAQVHLGDNRVFHSLNRQLHPRGKASRKVRLKVTSWLLDYLIEDVGRPKTNKKQALPTASFDTIAEALGKTDASLHSWLLKNGLTISPIQRSWLDQLSAEGWSLAAVLITPLPESVPNDGSWGPIITLTHESEAPVYPARNPPFGLVDQQPPPAIPLTLGVLSEWPVLSESPKLGAPFVARPLPGRRVRRIAKLARRHEITFRRDGFITAFSGERPSGLGLYRFKREDSLEPVKPKVQQRVENIDVPIPVEGGMLLALVLLWGWRTSRRGKTGRMVGKLR